MSVTERLILASDTHTHTSKPQHPKTLTTLLTQMLTKSVTERLILASDTNLALQGVSSMQEQLRTALAALASSDAQLKDAVTLVQGLRERLDVAEARVSHLCA